MASIGQVNLISLYRKKFHKKNIQTGQILLSEYSLKHRESYLKARTTINKLLDLNAVPIINENDPLATEELQFGDNDVLGALVSGLIDADLYMILSDTDGFYLGYNTSNPVFLPEIKTITKKIREEAGNSKGSVGTGGMVTKLKAAALAQSFAIPTFLTSGKPKNLMEYIFTYRKGTVFLPGSKQMKRRKKWIASGMNLKGRITVDEGAVSALNKRKSLLPSGMISCEGDFRIGDLVGIFNEKDELIAKGLCHYDSRDVKKLKGVKTSEIKTILGQESYHEIIHANNLVLTESSY